MEDEVSAEYFVPRDKPGLVAWLSRYWPEDYNAFNRKTKEQLYGIFYRVLADIKRGKYPGGKGGSK
jgi:hypothetical protein